MSSKRTYSEMKSELEDILNWFEVSDIDVEEALTKHKQAEKLLKEIEAFLTKTEANLNIKAK